ncbi:MAG TPA: Gfo/Idh/MocA family oxidoreductase, partial [Flavisolibacter sp.]|nr:Gfo/Idh/MocA family oxidoreductase [Flavisolibacter sp.]
MPESKSSSRRKFLQKIAGSALVLAVDPLSSLASQKAEERILLYQKKISSNDKIRLGVIGMGIMGFNDVTTALKVPGVELAAACDLYSGRLERAKEVYGNDLFTTKDYRELLNRSDIDAVIIATSDNWHARIAKDALEKGKAVYCEKPMVHRISEGLPL